MLFDLEKHFQMYEFTKLIIYPNFQTGLKYGFIFFVTAMLLGLGLNYGYRFLKI